MLPQLLAACRRHQAVHNAWRAAMTLIVATAGLAAAQTADPGPAFWQGSYQSVSLSTKNQPYWVTVQLTPPAAGRAGELRFVTRSCALALEPVAADGYLIGLKPDEEPGPYCGLYIGGQVLTQADAADRALQVTITDRNGNGKIRFKAVRT